VLPHEPQIAVFSTGPSHTRDRVDPHPFGMTQENLLHDHTEVHTIHTLRTHSRHDWVEFGPSHSRNPSNYVIPTRRCQLGPCGS
jgi:hypothetical protein